MPIHNSRVFIVSPNWQTGGVERTNIQWRKCLELADKEVAFVTCSSKEDVDINTSGFWEMNKWIIRNLQFGDTLVLVQTWYLWRLFPVLLFVAAMKTKVILSERNTWSQYAGYSWLRRVWIQTWIGIYKSCSTHIIVNSDSIRNSHSIYKNSIVVNNPRWDKKDIARFLSSNVRDVNIKRVVMFIRWHDQKDIRFIQEISTTIDEKYCFEVYCNERDFQWQKPYVDDPIKVMLDNDVIILHTSKFEGYPNVLIEARSCGTPILYFDSGSGEKEVLKGYDLSKEFSKDDFKLQWPSLVYWMSSLKDIQTTPDLDFIRSLSVSPKSILNELI